MWPENASFNGQRIATSLSVPVGTHSMLLFLSSRKRSPQHHRSQNPSSAVLDPKPSLSRSLSLPTAAAPTRTTVPTARRTPVKTMSARKCSSSVTLRSEPDVGVPMSVAIARKIYTEPTHVPTQVSTRVNGGVVGGGHTEPRAVYFARGDRRDVRREEGDERACPGGSGITRVGCIVYVDIRIRCKI